MTGTLEIRKAPAQINVEVWKYDKRHWELRVKAQSDYNFIGEIGKEFKLKLRPGKNLITHPHSPYYKFSKVKEYFWFYPDHLTYIAQQRGTEIDCSRFFYEPLEVRGMWKVEGFRISEEGKMIWWLWERKKYEEKIKELTKIEKINENEAEA
ncbi:MAG: hypothetical protein I3273_04160 [Candidatus Moeniiplasma glomeromycotorum]|nr:hypothetical protein [Candidatus Moeniiplasma glomeromycotorum]